MDFLECKICHIPYDEDDHRPRSAQCGHELCTACLRSLITNGLYCCPKCREVTKINVPDDLPVNFGLIDVIRAFKTNNLSVVKETGERLYGATNYEICKVHHKAIEYRCLGCEMWICDDCQESHTTLIGCRIVSSSIAVDTMKKKQNQDANAVLTIFNSAVNCASFRIEEHAKKRKEHIEMANKHAEEEEKLSYMLEQGNDHKKYLIESQKHLTSADSPYALMDRIDELTTRKQFLHSWTVKNLGDGSLNYYRKVSGEEKNFYAEMKIKDIKQHAKISKNEDSFYFHSFKEETIGDGCISIPMEYLQNIVPNVASHVFLQLSFGGISKGHVVFRLNKDIKGIENIVDLFIGKQGPCLKGIKLSKDKNSHLGNSVLSFSFSKIPFNNKNENPLPKKGDLLGDLGVNYFRSIFFNMCESVHWPNFTIIGHVEEGLSVIQNCYDNSKGEVIISDCGIIINQE